MGLNQALGKKISDTDRETMTVNIGDSEVTITGYFLEQLSVRTDVSRVEFVLVLGDGRDGLLRSLPGLCFYCLKSDLSSYSL